MVLEDTHAQTEFGGGLVGVFLHTAEDADKGSHGWEDFGTASLPGVPVVDTGCGGILNPDFELGDNAEGGACAEESLCSRFS